MSLPAPPIELEAPDIRAYRAGNTGVDYVTTFVADAPGPHVMVSAVVHGNELCGAIALDFLLRSAIRPARGRLTLAFMNVAAYERFDPGEPTASRYVDEDFNRVWSEDVLTGPGDSVELRRARAVRDVLNTVDLLLDIHSMQHATPPLMMAGPLAKGRRLASAVGTPEIVVSDAGHAGGTRMRDYAGFADAGSQKNALLVECGQHWDARSAEVAVETMLRFLVAVGTIDAAIAAPHLPSRPPRAQRFIEVTEPHTVRTDRFRFVEDYVGMEVIAAGGSIIAHDGEAPVRTPYDDCVLIMPSRRLTPGQSAVRFGRYVSPPRT